MAGELKNMLSEISCPLFGLASEVLDLPTLNKITGERCREDQQLIRVHCKKNTSYYHLLTLYFI